MKRIVCLFVATMFVLILSACQFPLLSSSSSQTVSQQEITSSETPVSGEVSDTVSEEQPALFEKTAVTGIQADSIAYYQTTIPCPFAVIKQNGKYGLIDYDGKMVLPTDYNLIEPRLCVPVDGIVELFVYDENGAESIVRPDGTLKPAEEIGVWGYVPEPEVFWCGDHAVMLHGGEEVELSFEEYALYAPDTRTMDVFVTEATAVIPVRKIDSYDLSDGYAFEGLSDTYGLFDFKTKTMLTDFVFDAYNVGGMNEGVLAVCQNGKWGYVNDRGEMLTDFVYDAAKPCEDPLYASLYPALNGYVILKQGDKWGMMTTDGTIVLETVYDAVSQANEDGKVWVNENGSWSVLQLRA